MKSVTEEIKIPPAVWRYIEHELYSYEQTKRDLEYIREEIIEGQPFSEIPVQTGPGNPTEKKGIKLITSPGIIRLTRTADAIEKTLNQLSEEHTLLFNLKYCQGKDWRIVCQEIPTSERSYFRLRREIVTMVAEKLGMI